MIFDIGMKILIFGLIVFFIIFAVFCYYWTEPSYTRKEKLIIAFMVSFLHSCVIFPLGVVILFLVDLATKYLPDYLRNLPF